MQLSTNVILGLALVGMLLCGFALFVEKRTVVGSRPYRFARGAFWAGLGSLLCAPIGVLVFEIGQQVWVWWTH